MATDFAISRQDQDMFALSSQQKAAEAQQNGRFAKEITSVTVPQRRGDDIIVDRDEHLRSTTLEKLNGLPTPFRENGSATAGNSSGVNDGAAALLVASKEAIKIHNLTPIARIVAGATAGVEPRIMGIGPAPAVKKLLEMTNINLDDFGVLELNEAFASQAIAVLRALDLAPDDPRVNPNGGAIALGHPLGMSGARIVGSAAMDLHIRDAKLGMATMCVGVGQGISIALERV